MVRLWPLLPRSREPVGATVTWPAVVLLGAWQAARRLAGGVTPVSRSPHQRWLQPRSCPRLCLRVQPATRRWAWPNMLQVLQAWHSLLHVIYFPSRIHMQRRSTCSGARAARRRPPPPAPLRRLLCSHTWPFPTRRAPPRASRRAPSRPAAITGWH